MATASKRQRVGDVIEGLQDAFEEIFGGEDSGKEFEGFEETDSEDEEQDNFEIDMTKWKMGDRSDIRLPPFTGPTGIPQNVRSNMPDQPTYLDFFKLFISDEVVEHIKTETNRYFGHIVQIFFHVVM